MHPIFKKHSTARVRPLPSIAALLCLALLAACSSDGPKYAASETAAAPTPKQQAATTQLPRTNLPMPPVASSHTAATRDVGWTMLDGRRARLADYRGQVVVLDLYATYCPPCLKEIPHLVSIQRQYGQQGLSVIGLNAGGPEDQLKVPQAVEKYGIQYQLGNPDDEFVEMLSAGDDTIPKTFVFDRRGRLVHSTTGFDEAIKAELNAAVQAALGSKAD